MEGVWLGLRTHIKKKCFKKGNPFKVQWPLQLVMKLHKDIQGNGRKSDTLKKMGSHLTKLEEAKLKKPNPRVKVLNKEEWED